MKIYTRTGDTGTTALFGGDRVPKTHPRIAAYGTVDEVNSVLGLARAHARAPGAERLASLLTALQEDLFVLGADLATPPGSRAQVPRITAEDVVRLESTIDALDADLPPLKHFILPGGTMTASLLHLARTVCRRAERRTLEAATGETISAEAITYLNRLSDLLFVMARWANKQADVDEAEWEPRS